MRKMTLAAKAALLAVVSAGAIAACGSAARADVACNRWGECWTVRDRYSNYPPNLGVVFHDDDWGRQHRHGHWRWRRDRDDDHGYYSHGHWRAFDNDRH